MSSAPIFTATPRCSVGVVSTANSNRDGTGAIVDVFVAGSAGSRIDHLDGSARTSTTLGALRLYLSDGTNSYLWREISIPTQSITGTSGAYEWTRNLAAAGVVLILPTGWKLQCSCQNSSEVHHVFAFGGDF